jgi:hypothetical protein
MADPKHPSHRPMAADAPDLDLDLPGVGKQRGGSSPVPAADDRPAGGDY